MPDTPPPEGLYIYCVIRCAEPRRFVTLGIGERGDAVYTVNEGDLAAVVSDSPVVRYDALRRNMMAHTYVLEEVMREFTVLPVRFGTIATDAETVRTKLLRERHDELQGLLAGMDGRIELGLKVLWHEDTLFKEIVDENPPIKSLRDSLQGKPPEETHFERMRLGEMVQDAMERKREHDAELVLSRLRPLVERLETTKVLTERMVVNAALLVDKDRESLVDREVDQLDVEYGHRLVFKYVGSVPPYNFVNLTVTW